MESGPIAAVVVALPLLLALLVGTGLAVVVNVEIAASADNTLFQDPAGLTSDGSGEHFFVGRSNQNDGNVQMRCEGSACRCVCVFVCVCVCVFVFVFVFVSE